MRVALYAFLIFYSVQSFGFKYEPGKCYPSYPLKCFVNQKIDSHHLGLLCNNQITNSNVILEVREIGFYGEGPINIKFSYKGTKKVKLLNGFDATAELWKDCEGANTEEALAEKIKSRSCEDICFKQDKKGKDLERCIKASCD